MREGSVLIKVMYLYSLFIVVLATDGDDVGSCIGTIVSADAVGGIYK